MCPRLMPRPLCVLYSVLITGSGPRPSVSLPRLLTGRTVTRCPSRGPAFALPSAPPRSYKASFLMYKTSAKRVNLYIRNIMPTGAPLPRVASVCYACYDKATVLTICTYEGGEAGAHAILSVRTGAQTVGRVLVDRRASPMGFLR